MSKQAILEAVHGWSDDDWREVLLHAPDLADRLRGVLPGGSAIPPGNGEPGFDAEELRNLLKKAWHLGFDSSAEGSNAEWRKEDDSELEAWAESDIEKLLAQGASDRGRVRR
ncbi:hypothetical protein ACE15N_21920 (plasmid) [Xanthomonas campestris pv. passiflorae]